MKTKLILVLITCFLFSGCAKQEVNEPSFERKTITYNNEDYFPRQDIETFLVLGIDEFGKVESSGSYRNERNADVILLMVLDKTNETYDVLCLNRDTMVEMPILGVTGASVGTATQQLALAHTYGSGLVDSCENMRTTVSHLLNNITIDHFIAMNMDGIEMVTDALGGIEVTITDDFSAIDTDLWQGTHILTGKQAVTFVQVRKEVGDQLNSSRMERQKEFLMGVEEAFKENASQDFTKIKKVYEQLEDYMVSDCSLHDFTLLVDSYSHYTCEDIIIPEGHYEKGTTYMEFYLDKKAFLDTIIELLYEKKAF